MERLAAGSHVTVLPLPSTTTLKLMGVDVYGRSWSDPFICTHMVKLSADFCRGTGGHVVASSESVTLEQAVKSSVRSLVVSASATATVTINKSDKGRAAIEQGRLEQPAHNKIADEQFNGGSQAERPNIPSSSPNPSFACLTVWERNSD